MSDDKGAPLSLDVTGVSAGLVRPGSLWRAVRVVAETGSSNADLLAAAGAGAAEGTVLVAEAQTMGRGRLGRRWASPPRAGLTFSVLLRPAGVPAALLGWLPLLAGVAAAAAVSAVAAVDATLKWPNDVLAGEQKLGGILAERAGTAVVVGIGINVWQARADLPRGRPPRPWRWRPGRGPPARRRTPAARACASGCWPACLTNWRAGTWPGGTRPARGTRTRAGCARSTSAGAARWAAK